MATLWEHYGNVFESDCTVILHQANCYAIMGSGIAKEVKQRFPAAFEADRMFEVPVGSRERLGKFSYGWNSNNTRVVFNLYGQHRYGRDQKYTEEDMLEKAILGAFDKLSENRANPDFRIKIGLPKNMGCGLAGGDWEVVKDILQQAADEYGFDLNVYQLQ